MTTPDYLKPGDTIGIVATARSIGVSHIRKASRILKSWGYNIREAGNLSQVHHQFAGTDEVRAKGLQSMLDDPEVKAILCARGGYGTVRIIDRIDFSRFREKPKWIMGFSDVTVLHSHIHRHFGVETLHCNMPVAFPDDPRHPSLLSIRDALSGKAVSFEIPRHPFNRPGEAQGQVVGGNLSMLYSLMGSPSDLDTDGKILFLEELDEYLYHVDRMMMNLKRSGRLDRIRGMVVGGMTDMNDNPVAFGHTAGEIVRDAVTEYNYPVIFSFPAGHISDNRVLILGRKATLKVGDGASLEFNT